MDRYVVIGNPVAHSLSPTIHALFAQETGERLAYDRLRLERADFEHGARAFFEAGGCGANVTLPFKVDAFNFATLRSARAERAGAANFLMKRADGVFADNTDGAGLLADLARNLAFEIRGRRVLLAGAGGAARGVVAPILEAQPARLLIANRTAERASDLARAFASLGPVDACALDAVSREPFDLVLNATSTSTHGEPLALTDAVFARETLAYDMAYGPAARAFVAHAQSLGARATDGLGMLVEQAAESFLLWRGKRPSTGSVLAQLRAARD